ncbi:MAG: PilN domain-containing protein [Candidatus Aminicenantes bacterium]|nr:PilN domain-containing protein [Candidatus Aminicenantes bacterium]
MIRINLLKPETKEIREGPPAAPVAEVKEKKAPPIANVLVVLAVAVLAALFFLQKRALDQERQRLAVAQEEKRQLAYVSEKLVELQKQKEIFEKKINLITSLKAQQPIAVIILNEINKCLPDWVWLTEVSYENRFIQIRGNALSNNLIADFIRNLEDSPYLQNVDLKSSIQRTSTDQTFLEFALTLQFLLPQDELPSSSSPEKPKDQGEKKP